MKDNTMPRITHTPEHIQQTAWDLKKLLLDADSSELYFTFQSKTLCHVYIVNPDQEIQDITPQVAEVCAYRQKDMDISMPRRVDKMAIRDEIALTLSRYLNLDAVLKAKILI